jgi:DNA polymerase-3 subunit delta'
MERFLPHVFGQNRVQAALAKALQNHRMPHTLIFYGDEGLGKTTAAFDLAGHLTGQPQKVWAPDAAPFWMSRPDGEGDSVYSCAENRVWYITPPHMELSIQQVHLFLDAMVTFDSSAHVCILDEAQTMGPAISNALLKTLEEPADNMYFILVTHQISRMLPTIISRSEQYHFLPLSLDEFRQFADEKRDLFSFQSEQDVENAWRLAGGNPGTAVDIFDKEGLSAYEEAIGFWETLTHDPTPFASLEAGHMADKRESFDKALSWIHFIGRNLMLLSDMPQSAEQVSHVTEREKKLAPFWDNGRAEAALEVIRTAMQASRRYISSKNTLDMMIIRLLRIKKGDISWNRS